MPVSGRLSGPGGGDRAPAAGSASSKPGSAGNEAERSWRPGERSAGAGGLGAPWPGRQRLGVGPGQREAAGAAPAPGGRTAESRFAAGCVQERGRAARASGPVRL